MTHHILAFDVNSDGFLTRFARCSLVDLKLPTVFTHEGGYSENHVPYCGLRVVESLCGMIVSASSVKTTDDEEAALYSYQTLQPWQRAVIESVYETNASHLINLCKE